MSDETFPSGGRRRSLLIGINYAGQKVQLEGCVNDVQKMRGVLEKVGFPQYEQRILVDHPPIVGAWGKPTKEKIIESLKWLTEGARPGDTLFLHYSGHGVQIPDDDGDEADGMDEALVPLDYLTAGVIRDDLIHEIVVKHLPSGIRVTAVMDCCHSGTLLDLPYEWVASDTSMHSMLTKARSYIKGDGTWFSSAINQIGLNLMRAPSKTRITKRDFVLSNQKHILCDAVAFSGCRDEESCADVATSGTTTLSTIEAGSSGGVCTAALVEALESGETFTFIDLLYRMREILKKLDFTQVPQLSSSKPVDMQRPFSFFGPIDEYVVKRDDEIESATSTFNTDVGESQSEHDDPSENVTFPSVKLVHDFERQPNQPVPTMTTLSVTRTEQETEKTSIFSPNTSQSSTAHMFSSTYSNSNSGMVHNNNNNNNNNVSFTSNAVASSNLPSSIPSNTNSSQQLATKSYLNDASSSTSLFPSRSPNSPTAGYTTFNSSNKGSTSPRSLNLNSSLGRSEFPSLTVNTAPDTSSFNFVPQTPLSPVMVTPASPTAAGSPRGSLFYDKPASPKSGSVPGKYNALPESVGSGASSSYGSSSPSGGNQFKSTVENSTGYYSSIPGSISNHKNTNETYDMVSSSPSSMNMKQSPSFYIRNDQRSEEQVTMNSTSDTTSFASNISGSQTTLGISAQEQQYSAPSTQQLGYATTVTVSPTASFAANYTPISPSGTVVNTAATYTPISASMAGAQTYCPVPTYASSPTLPYSVPNTYVQQNYYSSPTHAVQSEVYTSPSGYYTAAPQMVYYSGAAPSYSSPTYVMGSYY